MHGAFLTPQELGDNFFFEKNGMKGGKSKKNMKGVFFTAEMGAEKIVLMESMIYAFWTFVKNTP